MCGITLDGWQETVLEAALGERSDSTWAAKRVGISAPRQNGKSQLLVARALAGALLFGERKIVVSAHQQDTARESFGKMVEIIEDDANSWLRDRIPKNGIMNAINRETVKFTNGAKIQFKARSGAAGKGFSSDCLLLDEAQILGSRAWTSINSTMSAMPNPQVWLLGTPPQDEDDCFTFDMVRRAALDGKSTASAWLEWSADLTADDYDPASEFTRWQANPAWNTRINHDVVQGEFETYSPDRFAQDRLGVWRADAAAQRLIPPALWVDTAVNKAPSGGIRSFAVAFSADGKRQAIAGALKHENGVHVELIGAFSGSTERGVAGVADWLAERAGRTAEIALVGRAGSSVLASALQERGVPRKIVHVMSSAEYFGGNAMFLDGLRDGSVTHPVAPKGDALDQSVSVCDKKVRGFDGAWGWEPTTPDGDETPLEAVSAALYVARTTKRRPKGGSSSRGGVRIL